MKNRETTSDRIVRWVIYVALTAMAFLCLYPLYVVLISSFSDPGAVAQGKVTLVPVGLTLDAYKEAFKTSEILIGYRNSLFYTIVGTVINMLLLIPGFLLMKGLHLTNTVWAVLLAGGCSASNLIIARSFFMSGVPRELEEAAEIDGCNPLQTFLQIVLPLSKAMLSVILLYYAVSRWNNYTASLYYQPSANDLHSLQMVLRGFITRANVAALQGNENADYYAEIVAQLKYSVIVIASVPLLVIYPFIQKYFEKGVMLGSVKG